MKFLRANAEKKEQNREAYLDVIEIEKIRPNPYQPRRYFQEEAIRELSRSIKEVGLLQPITVRKVGEDYYELIAGERRLRASKLLGEKSIRAIVTTETMDEESAMLAMVENLQRENLHFFEEAEGYQRLIREHGCTQEELAKRLSKNQSTIANKMRILKLAPDVKKKILEYGLTERHARALLRLHHEKAQMRLMQEIHDKNLSVKETENLVERELEKLYGEEKETNVIKMRCNYRIYINTIKKTVSKLKCMGAETTYSLIDHPESVEIVLKVMK